MFKQVITSYLDSLNLKWKESGQGYLLCQCPNPKHNDTNESCFVSTDEGWLSCKSCGHYIPPSFFKDDKISEQLIDIEFQKIIDKIANSNKKQKETTRGFNLPPKGNVLKEYRGLYEDFILRAGLYEATSGRFKNRLIIPFTNHKNQLVGYTGRLLINADKSIPKYMHVKGVQPSDHILFGKIIKDLCVDTETLVITEGTHDALHLLQRGIPATPTLGFRSPSDSFILEAIELGAEKVIICWDNDSVGIKKMLDPSPSSLIKQWRAKIPTELGMFHKDFKFLYKTKFKDFGEYYENLYRQQDKLKQDIRK